MHGLPRYNKYDGSVEWSGEDLNSEGLTAYMFDIIYITWFVHFVSMFWEAAWWIYLVIPAYALYKIWSSFIQPYLFSSSSENDNTNESKSKRQQKKMLRQDSGTGGGAKTKIKYR
ncbi:12312_t:CDS:2 [Ambispora gerdemannii]|uniref:12312_t:CDS:1 n=1 Tax=Ambispora gerdemannii TaxID=144530 RepID=A0A9N8ZVF5_9GLOM|nr:12312_t:CDS:2 [Ambispora gerdemannii]